MKKLALLLAVTLLLLVFAGCQLADIGGSMPAGQTTPTQTVPTQTIPVTDTQDTALLLPLTKQSAIEVAFKNAGVTNEEVQHLHARQDTDSGVVHYDVDFRHGEYYYAYEISEKTGEILKLETEHDRTALPQTQIAKEEAEQIALEHEGFTRDDVKFLSVEFDREDHRYEVEFTKDGVEYVYEICAEFGKILDIDKDWDD